MVGRGRIGGVDSKRRHVDFAGSGDAFGRTVTVRCTPEGGTMRAKGGRTERSDEAEKRPHLALTCFIHVAETVLNVPNFPHPLAGVFSRRNRTFDSRCATAFRAPACVQLSACLRCRPPPSFLTIPLRRPTALFESPLYDPRLLDLAPPFEFAFAACCL